MSGNHAGPVPVSVLTGFLGSGKTTLLRALLQQKKFANTAVLINELGDIGIDHLLVSHVSEELIVLEGGCLCCTLRGDLVKQLGMLWARRMSGELPTFSRVVLETSGLADPAPILATLLAHPELSEHFYVDGVVCTFDAEQGLHALEHHSECAKQLAVADRIVITKCDRVDAAKLATVQRELESCAPGVAILHSALGTLDPSKLFDLGHLDTRALVTRAHRQTQGATGHSSAVTHTQVESISVTLERPISFAALSWWVSLTTQLHGEHILRFKAIISALGEPTPIAVQAVQHVVYPPLNLPAMPELGGKSHIVVLTTGLSSAVCAQLRDSLVALGA